MKKANDKAHSRGTASARPGRFTKPSQWYGAALVMPVIGVFMAGMEANDVANRRLRNPVLAIGEFVSAECIVHKRRRSNVQWDVLQVNYEFVATGYVKPAEGDRPAITSPKFTAIAQEVQDSREACDTARAAAYAARALQQLWFERDYSYESMTTLDEPNSWRLLLIGLFGIPFFIIGWVLRWRHRRKAQQARGFTQ